MLKNLRVPKWTEKDDSLLRYIQSVVAVSKPSIQGNSKNVANNCFEQEFDQTFTSKPLIEGKRAERHKKARGLLERDPMFVVPKDQLQAVPGLLDSEVCTFDFFTNSVKQARNFKKDLKSFQKKRA